MPRDVYEIRSQPIRREPDVIVPPVDTEVAGVRTADARQNWNDAVDRPSAKRRRAQLRQPLLDRRQLGRRPIARHRRPRIDPAAYDIVDERPVARVDDDVEEAE